MTIDKTNLEDKFEECKINFREIQDIALENKSYHELHEIVLNMTKKIGVKSNKGYMTVDKFKIKGIEKEFPYIIYEIATVGMKKQTLINFINDPIGICENIQCVLKI